MKFISLISLLIPIICFSQEKEYSIIECIYDYRYVRDTTSKMGEDGSFISGNEYHIVKDSLLLQIGNKASRYYKYSTFYKDSLIQELGSLTGTGLKKSITGAEYIVYKDKTVGKIITTDEVAIFAFKVTENMPEFAWEIKNERKEVAGYKVFKAECSFRGRKWVAWFAPDLPISDGPWKFSGLPGLIMEVYDEMFHYRYGLVGIREVSRELSIPDVNYIETSLKEYYKTKRISIEDLPSLLSSTSSRKQTYKDTDGNTIDPKLLIQKMKYDFPEIIK